MWSLILFGIGMGLVDCLNPFTISTQIVFQPFVKKAHHTLYYIVGTYLCYLLGGLFVYWGIDQVLKAFWNDIMASYSTVVFSVEASLGVVIVGVSLVFLYKQMKKSNSIGNDKKATAPKSVKPAFLFFFGASNTVFDLPTAFPLLIFIARLTEESLTTGTVIALLAGYCLIYVMPLLLVFGLCILNQKKLERLFEKLQRKFAAISGWATVALSFIAGVFISVHGCISLGIN